MLSIFWNIDMPITVIDTIEAKSSGYPVIVDTSIQGGFQALTTTTARDAIPAFNRKAGMLVYVTGNTTYYQLGGDLVTWNVVSFGGFTAANDLSGSSSSQTVVGIRGVPVSAASVANDGFALVSTGGIYVPTGVKTVYNVKNFGAKGDNATDDTAAINAAITAASNAGVGAEVFFPTGAYHISQPLQITTAGITLTGERTFGGVNSSALLNINANGSGIWYGPALIIGNGQVDPTYVTNGTLHLATMIANPNSFIDLSRMPGGSLNGMSAFTFSCFLNPQGNVSSGSHVIIASSGSLGTETISSGFSVFLMPTNTVQVILKTTGGTVTFTSDAPLPANTITYFAVSYDGAHVRMFLAGVMQSTVPALTGTIIQQPWESLALGIYGKGYPCNSDLAFFLALNGLLIGSIHLNQSAVYTSTFTPPPSTADLAPIFGDLIVLNFDPASRFSQGWLITIIGGGTKGYLPGFSNAYGGYVSNTTIQYLDFDGNWECIYCNGANGTLITDCIMTPDRRGVTFDISSYQSKLNRCNIVQNNVPAGHSWAFAALGSSDFFDVDKIQAYGAQWIFVVGDGTYGTFKNCYCVPGSFGALLANDAVGLTIYDCNFFDKAGSATKAMLYLANIQNFVMTGGLVGASFNPNGPVMIVDTCGSISINCDLVVAATTSPSVFSFLGSTLSPVICSPSSYVASLPSIPWIDGYNVGSLIIPQQSAQSKTNNFTTDADFTLAEHDFFYGTLIMTDSAVHLSTGRNVILPYVFKDYTRTVINLTAQILTFKAATGTGVAIGASKTAIIRSDGTNWIRVTADT